MKLVSKDRWNNRVATALTAVATSLVVNSVTGIPDAPFMLVIDNGNTKEEVVKVTAVTTLTKTLTIVRAKQGTTAYAHNVGAIVSHIGEIVAINCGVIADISTGETIYSAMPQCTVMAIKSCLEGAITVADATITCSQNAQAITGGVVTVANSGSGAGIVNTANPTLYDEFDGVLDYLKMVGGGESTDAQRCWVMALVVPFNEPA